MKTLKKLQPELESGWNETSGREVAFLGVFKQSINQSINQYRQPINDKSWHLHTAYTNFFLQTTVKKRQKAASEPRDERKNIKEMGDVLSGNFYFIFTESFEM